MKQHNDKELQTLLKQSEPAINPELQRDLWPQMLRRLDQGSAVAPWSRTTLTSIPWFDWALLAVLVLGIFLFPSSIPIWLYHL
jgi:hypothetical protein